MQARLTSGLVLAMGLAATGCAQSEGKAANSKFCTAFPAQPAASADPAAVTAVAAGGDAAAFDDCLHRWGYRLAKSKDGADLAAQATVAACAPILSRWNQSTLAQPQTGPDTAVSLITGKSNNTPADRWEMGQAKALFYVVQARAGNCAAP